MCAVVAMVSSMMEGSILEKPLTPLPGAELETGDSNQMSGELVTTQLNGEGSLEDELDWPQITEANALLVTPSFAKKGALEFHGGAAPRRRRAKELVREKSDPVTHEEMSRKVNFL